MNPSKLDKRIRVLLVYYNDYTVQPDNQHPGARFTKYLTTVLRLSYDNAKLTIDLRRTFNLQNILRRAQGYS